MSDIKELYEMLYQEDSMVTQIDMARQIKDLSVLIMPPAPPFVWEKCAYILLEKTDRELEPYLEGMVEWMQDLNWPGALTILERLRKVDGRILLQPFLNCYEREKVDAKVFQRAAYFWWDLLENKPFREVLPKDVRMCLENGTSIDMLLPAALSSAFH